MSLNNRIPETSAIHNFLIGLCFKFYFSKPVFEHIEEFIKGAISIGYKGKVSNIVSLSNALCHRSSYGKFLSKGAWNHEYIFRAIRKESLKWTLTKARQTRSPIFVIHDDTICEKTKPSSKAKCPIQKTSFHHSHLDKKKVFGHQMLTTLLSCSGDVLPYAIERYEKNGESKIDKVCRIVDSLPIAKTASYGLCDSWYTCQKVVEAHFKKGYHLIGALKTNRVIYPIGTRIQIKDFAQHIKKTIATLLPWVVLHIGHIDTRVILMGLIMPLYLSVGEKMLFKKPGCLHSFLCTDTTLDTQTILEYYSQRWSIEIFFRQTKGNFGFNKYQVRSSIAIDRILALTALTYLYCVIGTANYQALGDGLITARTFAQRDKIATIYMAKTNGLSLDDIFKHFNVA